MSASEESRADGPRVLPASSQELGRVNAALVALSGRVAKTDGPLNLFATMGRNRALFRRWLLFAGKLMPRGGLPRIDTELVILRVSHRTGAEYEAVHHRGMGRRAGLSPEQIAAVSRDDLEGSPFSPRQMLLLSAVDELHDESAISGETFAGLRSELSDRDLVELCMLAGHYAMLAGLINSLRIESDVHR